MEQRRWLAVAVLMCLLVLCSGRELKTKHVPIYDPVLARTLAEYTSAVYTADLTQLFTWTCERCCDLTEGFEVIELIVDVKNCLQAYVGFARDMNAVIVVFRGTQENSIQNWIEDLFWKQLDLDYPGMPEAKVHSGFYSAYHNTTMRDRVMRGIKNTRKLYGDIPIMVTGHSMGGAMASFCALDLIVNVGFKDVSLMTFGQPRIGNAIFASNFKRYLPNAIRLTNAHDIVPHLPPYYHYFPQKTYHHFPREAKEWISLLEKQLLLLYPVLFILQVVVCGILLVVMDVGNFVNTMETLVLGYEPTSHVSGAQVLPRFSSLPSNGSQVQKSQIPETYKSGGEMKQSDARKSSEEATPTPKVVAFSPQEAAIAESRSSPLTIESWKVRRSEIATKVTFYMIPALLLVSKNSMSTSLLVGAVFHQVYMFQKEILLDYVHHDITRKWALIYLKLLLLVMAKDTIMYFHPF
ncbi:Succinate dehydrogenase subunit 4, mitochondrial [Zea mays]|uniref:Succinate dehydrogenase subunit 4, mitochondrial n=1 Tax=Zea mays TaxID=4577 RepID=A0A3L6ECG2_MAIZE|nr:Succinate dehydrogenase subunit 4, mitochondrial [Zea mays]